MLIKKNCAYAFLIIFNCQSNNLSGSKDPRIFKLFDLTNKILLTFIEKKNYKNSKFKMIIENILTGFEQFTVDKLLRNLVLQFKILDLKRNIFRNFKLKIICTFSWLTYFFKIWTLNAYKKKLWLELKIFSN